MTGSNEYRYHMFNSMVVWLIHRGPLFVDDSDQFLSQLVTSQWRGVARANNQTAVKSFNCHRLDNNWI